MMEIIATIISLVLLVVAVIGVVLMYTTDDYEKRRTFYILFLECALLCIFWNNEIAPMFKETEVQEIHKSQGDR